MQQKASGKIKGIFGRLVSSVVTVNGCMPSAV